MRTAFLLALVASVALLVSTVASAQTVTLSPLWTYSTGVFDESAAEIVAYDPVSEHLFVVNGDAGAIDILDVVTGGFLGQLDVSSFGGPNSVAVAGGIVAVAVEAPVATDPGFVVFFDSVTEATLGSVVAGVLPDMVTFTPNGQIVLVANEAEPDGTDPAGSVSHIDISAGVANAIVTDLDFTAFDGREEEMRARGVRIFPGNTVSQDVEPEYIAVAPSGTEAFVTLQEANAFAVIDLTVPEIKDILPMGTKDHSRGQPRVTNYDFGTLPALGMTAAGQEILLGGLSGLWFEGVDPVDGSLMFATVPDRGPNGEPINVDADPENERPFALPDYQARVIRFKLDESTAQVTITETLLLTRGDGTTPITGLPNIPGVDEEPIDLLGNVLPYDEFGADLEGVIVDGDGNFWMVDEYRPAIYKFDAAGALIDRFVPAGTAALGGQAVGTYGTETLPAEYSNRRRNRGFEGMALDADQGVLYAFIQTPLANPDSAASAASLVIRMLGVDVVTGTPVAEYVYLLEKPSHREANVDKIGDAVYLGGGRFLAIERDSSTVATAKKGIFELDLLGATNLLAPGAPPLLAGLTLEQHTPADLATAGIQPVFKRKVLNLPSLGYLAGDKPEGLALLSDGRLAVLNDNDFGLFDAPIPLDGSVPINPNPTPVVLGLIDFPAGNTLDASDRDDEIRRLNWPVEGMFMPDSVASFEIMGKTYYITANEGDARNEDARVSSLDLDDTRFPNEATLKLQEELGRLEVSEIDGDTDQDGDYDRLLAYGARSFTIWDRFANLVFDSGDDFSEILATFYPGDFNSNNDENGSFDSRSDAKGCEPEAVATGDFNGKTLAYVGLERMGGIMIYDVTDPSAPEFVNYVLSRDFGAEATAAGDLGPEGIITIPTTDSSLAAPLVVVANEVSGTTTLYEVVEITNGFVRGDCNNDAAINIADGIFAVQTLFPVDPSQTESCSDACDANDDGSFDSADAITILNLLFAPSINTLAGPYPLCGGDFTADTLDCGSFAGCP